MKNTVLIRGRLAFLNLSVKNAYSDKLQFNLLVPDSSVGAIETAFKNIADDIKGEGFYDSIEHKKLKSGEELASTGYGNFKGKSYLTLKQDTFGWSLVDKNHADLEASKFNSGDLVLVLMTVGAIVHSKHGPLLFLNPKIIQQLESAQNNREDAFYLLEGNAFGEKNTIVQI